MTERDSYIHFILDKGLSRLTGPDRIRQHETTIFVEMRRYL